MCSSDLYEAGLYDFAKTYFEQQKNTNTNIQAEKYYYLGLVSIDENTDSADFYFEKAISVDPKSPWGYIGKGIIYLDKANEKESVAAFKKASSLGKKNPAASMSASKS